MATVYVGIVSYNSLNDLTGCFDALAKQSYADVKVTVLDNASVDESVAWVREHAPDCSLIINRENVGFGRAHNQIVKASGLQSGDFYMTLNPDATLMPEYIGQLVKAMTETGAGWAGGKILMKDENNQPNGLLYSAGQGIRRDGYVVNVGENMADAVIFNQEREVFAVTGAALMMRQETIRAIAADGELFDEQMFLYSEDMDAGWRARLQGWQCWYVPTAVAYHRGGKLDAKRRGQALGNTYLSVLKNAYPVDLITYNLPLIVVNLVLRLILSPSVGWALVRQMWRHSSTALGKRKPAKISRDEMLKWFQWTSEQPTTQATGMNERIQRYLSKNKREAALRS
ncbi:MAG: glycosyltransferase family 2 protein [Anaerolineae bacterium]|nr:glycosyltransferase family 2 protein [Anaerolineae bacterium]